MPSSQFWAASRGSAIFVGDSGLMVHDLWTVRDLWNEDICSESVLFDALMGRIVTGEVGTKSLDKH